MALLSFKDMYTAEYRPGEDELTNYRAYRRKRLSCEETETETCLLYTSPSPRDRG